MPLRTVYSESLRPAMNMALDVLLAGLVAASGEPVLRFYRWSEKAVSAGRRVPEEQAWAAALMYEASAVVRRPTGGGVLFHGDQMSFSLSWPRGRGGALRRLTDSYCSIHRAVQLALADMGCATVQVDCRDTPEGVLCCDNAVRGDLVDEGRRKVLGGAQWRLAGAALYQGHLWLPWRRDLETSIAARLGGMLAAVVMPLALTDAELEDAARDADEWAIRQPEAAAAGYARSGI